MKPFFRFAARFLVEFSVFAVLSIALAVLAGCVTGDIAPVHAQKPLDEPPASIKKVRREITLKQRRDLGVTIPNVTRVVRDLRRDGEVDDETSHAEIAAAVVARLEKEQPKAFGELAKGDRDWASFLEALASFIEKILPLILKLIG